MIVAVPVAPKEVMAELKKLADEVICLYEADVFFGVGGFYESFPQVTDEQAIIYLKKATS